MKKKILLCLGLGIIGIFVLGIVLVKTGFVGINLRNVKTREESIIVSINPKVMYNTDDKGYVKEVIPMNKDAVIYKEEEFIGLYINDAFDKTVEVATSYGYVKEGTEINISSLSEDSVYLEDIIYKIGNTNLNIKTKKLSKQDIETIKINLSNGEYTVWQNITVDEQGVSVEGEYITVPNPEEVAGRDDTYKPELHENKGDSGEQDEEPKTWVDEDGDGIYRAEPQGYGDYIKGEHVSLVPNGPVYYSFYSTSKIGCKDAIDKKACANWYINDLTPRKTTVESDLQTWIETYNNTKVIIEKEQQNYKNLEKQIANYDESSYTSLEDLNLYLKTSKSTLETQQEILEESQLHINAKTKEVEEYNKVLAVYYSVLNN